MNRVKDEANFRLTADFLVIAVTGRGTETLSAEPVLVVLGGRIFRGGVIPTGKDQVVTVTSRQVTWLSLAFRNGD